MERDEIVLLDLEEIFHRREQADEDAYFEKRDALLVQRLRDRSRLDEIATALAGKLHVDRPDLLRRIIDLGITLDTGAAFLLAPLLQVAWADGHVTAEQKALVLRMAESRGLAPGTPGHALITNWLTHRPVDTIYDAALEAIGVGLRVLPHDEAEEGLAGIMRACKEVAHAGEGWPWLIQLRSVSYEARHALKTIKARLRAMLSQPQPVGAPVNHEITA